MVWLKLVSLVQFYVEIICRNVVDLVQKVLIVRAIYIISERITRLIFHELVLFNQSQWNLPHVNSTSFLSNLVAFKTIFNNLWTISETLICIVLYLINEYLWLFHTRAPNLWDWNLPDNIDEFALERNCSTIWWVDDCSIVLKCIALS